MKEELIVSNGVWRLKSWKYNSSLGVYHEAYLLSEKDYPTVSTPSFWELPIARKLSNDWHLYEHNRFNDTMFK